MNKPIVELDKPKGKAMKYWESAKKASDFYNINVVNISYNVNGTTKQAKGHYFRFATAEEIEQYSKINDQLDAPPSAEPAPIAEIDDGPVGPTPVLPEVIQSDEIQDNTASAFARLLEESKKKFQNNSK